MQPPERAAPHGIHDGEIQWVRDPISKDKWDPVEELVLSMIHEANGISIQILDGGLPSGTCLDEVLEAGRLLDVHGGKR